MTFPAPKNFKRGRLIANKYTISDLAIAAAGIVLSLVTEVIFLLNIRENAKVNLTVAILLLIPWILFGIGSFTPGSFADRLVSFLIIRRGLLRLVLFVLPMAAGALLLLSLDKEQIPA